MSPPKPRAFHAAGTLNQGKGLTTTAFCDFSFLFSSLHYWLLNTGKHHNTEGIAGSLVKTS